MIKKKNQKQKNPTTQNNSIKIIALEILYEIKLTCLFVTWYTNACCAFFSVILLPFLLSVVISLKCKFICKIMIKTYLKHATEYLKAQNFKSKPLRLFYELWKYWKEAYPKFSSAHVDHTTGFLQPNLHYSRQQWQSLKERAPFHFWINPKLPVRFPLDLLGLQGHCKILWCVDVPMQAGSFVAWWRKSTLEHLRKLS